MNRRQKIIVSITGIFIVLLALVGLTYAYFLTRIRGNEKDKSISVTTANLELVYGNDDGSIIGDGELIEPDTTFETKTFTVTNNGNATVDNYAVILEDVKTYYNQSFTDENNTPIAAGTQVAFKRPEDFEITISCSGEITDPDTNETETTTCSGYTGTLPLMDSVTLDANGNPAETYITNGILTTNSIDVGEKHTYSVVLKYKEANTDQSDDMNKGLQGKFNIIDANNTVDITGIVTGHDAGASIVTNSTRRVSQINSDGSYKIVGLEADVHSIKMGTITKNEDGTETEELTEISKISIIKGNTAGVGTTTYNGQTIKQITITDNSRIANVGIDKTTGITVGTSIKNYNPFKEETLAFNIYDNASSIKNGTKLLKEAATSVGDDIARFSVIKPFSETSWYYDTSEARLFHGCGGNYATECNISMIGSLIGESCSPAIGKIVDCDNGKPIISEYTNEYESSLATEFDDEGKTYYYRGNVEDNYLTFGKMCWRIVRIQGDESIKLILEDYDDECNREMNRNSSLPIQTGSTDYTEKYEVMKKAFYDFQTTGKLNGFINKLQSGNWCLNAKEYSEYDYPSLKCSVNTTYTFEDVVESGNEIISESPMYVATLTADEVEFAGGKYDAYNTKYYLNNAYVLYGFWTLSSYYNNYQIGVLSPGAELHEMDGYSKLEFRPAVVLKPDSILATTDYIQDGTIDRPYVIR